MKIVKQQHRAIFSSNFQTMRQTYARYGSTDAKEEGIKNHKHLKSQKLIPHINNRKVEVK